MHKLFQSFIIQIKNFYFISFANKKIIFRHLIVSSICASTELSLFVFLYKLPDLSLAKAYLVSFLCATSIGYILHSYFTFSVGKIGKKSAMLFIFQASSILIFGFFILRVLIFCGLHPVFSKAIQLFITFGFNVVFGKKLTFRKLNV